MTNVEERGLAILEAFAESQTPVTQAAWIKWADWSRTMVYLHDERKREWRAIPANVLTERARNRRASAVAYANMTEEKREARRKWQREWKRAKAARGVEA